MPAALPTLPAPPADPPPGAVPPAGPAGWGATLHRVAALGSLALLLWQLIAAAGDYRTLRRDEAGLAALRSSLQRAARMPVTDIGRHAQALKVADCLALPWAGLLDRAEVLGRQGVRLTRLDADGHDGTVLLEGSGAFLPGPAFPGAAPAAGGAADTPPGTFRWRGRLPGWDCAPAAAGGTR